MPVVWVLPKLHLITLRDTVRNRYPKINLQEAVVKMQMSTVRLMTLTIK